MAARARGRAARLSPAPARDLQRVPATCQTAGGIAPLARLLGVAPATLSRWLEGAETAPETIYQACIDIVLLHDSGDAADGFAGKAM